MDEYYLHSQEGGKVDRVVTSAAQLTPCDVWLRNEIDRGERSKIKIVGFWTTTDCSTVVVSHAIADSHTI